LSVVDVTNDDCDITVCRAEHASWRQSWPWWTIVGVTTASVCDQECDFFHSILYAVSLMLVTIYLEEQHLLLWTQRLVSKHICPEPERSWFRNKSVNLLVAYWRLH